MSLWRQECFFALSIKNQCNCKFTFEQAVEKISMTFKTLFKTF